MEADMNELSAGVPHRVIIENDYVFEKFLGLYFFPPEAVSVEDVPDELLSTAAGNRSVTYFATTLFEIYNSTDCGQMFIAVEGDRAWGAVEINFPEVFSDVVEVSAKTEVEAADKIGEALDLSNFDIFEPYLFGKVPAGDLT
jgi:hypothetical protein